MTVTTSLFVKGLSKGCTERHVVSVFSQFGAIVDCQIARHRSGRSAGFAIVTFAEHASAAKALQVADSSMLFGRPLSVRWYSAERSQEGRQQEVEHQHLASFLHGNMAHDVLLQQLAERAAWTSALHVAGSSGGASLASEQQPGSAAGSWLNMGAWLNMSQKPLQEEAAAVNPTCDTRRSSDGLTPNARRTTAGSVPLSLDGLDLPGLVSEAGSDVSASLAVEDPGSIGKSRLVTKWAQHSRSSTGSASASWTQDPISLLTCSSCLSDGGLGSSGSMSLSARDVSDDMVYNMASMNLSDSILSSLDESLSSGSASGPNTAAGTPRNSVPSLGANASIPLPPLPARSSLPTIPGPMDFAVQRSASMGMIRTAPGTPSKVHASSLSFDHLGAQPAAPGVAMHLQAAMKQQVQQLSAAQHQYASALAQLQAAQSKILVAAAAFQGQQTPFSAGAPPMAPMGPRPGAHAGMIHPGLSVVQPGGMDLSAINAALTMGHMGMF